MKAGRNPEITPNQIRERLRWTGNLVKDGKDTGDLDTRIGELNKSVQDISDMKSSDKIFTFNDVGNTGSPSIVINGTNGVFTLDVNMSDIGTTLHESRHGGDIARGTLSEDNYNVNHEISAYRAQYSFSGTYSYSAMPSNFIENLSFSQLGVGRIVTISNIGQINRAIIHNMVEAQPGISGFKPVRMYPPAILSKAQWELGFNKKAYMNRR